MEQELVLDKKFDCPICMKEFNSKQVKTGRARFLGTDEDLRPKYSGVDTIKYDVLFCPHCGYAAVSREFNNVTSMQRQVIREGIANKFKGVSHDDDTYSYEDAIYRYKMALLTAMVKPAKLSEASYIALKLSWLYRGAKEEIENSENHNAKLLKAYIMGEKHYCEEAYKGLAKAVQTEYPPICGMDEGTVNYLMSVLAYYNGDYDDAQRYAYMVIGSRTVTSKLKQRQRDFVEKIKAAKNDTE
ncbi:MAG: DUF2225 domain-containing protein [Lachnospira sp.]|nr:DUF2225 domain-containing protein [Lachnospira sp.]